MSRSMICAAAVLVACAVSGCDAPAKVSTSSPSSSTAFSSSNGREAWTALEHASCPPAARAVALPPLTSAAAVNGECSLLVASDGAVSALVDGAVETLAKGAWIGEPTALLVNRGEVWVAGNAGDERHPYVRVLARDGQRRVALPKGTTGVVGLGPGHRDEVIAATTTRRGGALVALSGSRARIIRSLTEAPVRAEMTGDANVIIAGGARGRSVVQVQSGARWAREVLPARSEVQAIAGKEKRVVLAVNHLDTSGTVTSVAFLESDDAGASWKTLPSPTWSSLTGLALDDHGDIVAAVAKPDGPIQVVHQASGGWKKVVGLGAFDSAVTLVAAHDGAWVVGDQARWLPWPNRETSQ